MKPVVRCGVVIFGLAWVSGCREDTATRIAELRDLARKPTSAQTNRIAEAFGDADRDVRATSLVLMSELDPDRAHPMALQALGDPDGVVRGAAVRTLAGRLDAELVEKLASLGPEDPVWQVRNAVLVALAGAEGEKVRIAFERGLTDPAAHVRRAALAAGLARPGLLPTALVARAVAADEDWENRVAAAGILGASRDPEAYAPLDEAAVDPHEFVRSAATRERAALARGGTPRPSPPPTPSPSPETTKRPPGV